MLRTTLASTGAASTLSSSGPGLIVVSTQGLDTASE